MNRLPTPHAPRGGLVALAASSVAALLVGCSEAVAPTPVAQAVYVTPVRLEHAAGERRYTATLAPRVESEIAFRTGGKVLARLVDVGQRVRLESLIGREEMHVAALAKRVGLKEIRHDD